MRGIDYSRMIIFVLLGLFIASTSSFAGNPESKPFLSHISKTWTEITPGPTEFMGRDLNPTCSGAPGTDPTFKFFVKGGSTNNLIVFFDGGGACWNTMNCIYAQTYSPEADETIEDLIQGSGIFDLSNPANPFIDWNFVFIPYCTGDIHWGSADKKYPGSFVEDDYTIHHRGFDNFLVVLKWILENFVEPHKIFVTGSSAGSYGALLGFPYIQEAYPESRVSMLGDAGLGVVTEDFQNSQIYNWGFQENLPAWIPGFEKPFSDYSIAEMYKMIAAHYPHSKIGQYTTAWDSTQAFFYNVMINSNNPLRWSHYTPVWCDWHDRMLEHADLAAQAPNYRFYIGAGTDHTIMAYAKFYEENSAGVFFVDWIKAMLEDPEGTHGYGGLPWMNAFVLFMDWIETMLEKMGAIHEDDGIPWMNVECVDCSAPVTCP